MRLGRFTAELRRRKVFRTAGLYLIGSWLVLQIADVTFAPIGFPDWIGTLLIWAVIMGFPVILLLGWRYELGPHGLVLTQSRKRADAEPAVSLRRTDYLILAVVALIVAFAAYGVVSRSGTYTVAVLPFVSASDDPTDQLLSAGFSDELRDQLNQAPGLQAAGRPSSISFRDQEVDAQTVSSRLGAAYVVTGRLTGSAVSVQLVDGRTGVAVWEHPYDRRAQDLLAIQREMATEIIARIVPGAQAATATAPATSDVSAYERLLLARSYEQQVREQLVVDEAKLDRAIELYREAIDLDPGSVIAHARLAGALLYSYDVTGAGLEINEALKLAETLTPGPELSEVYYAQALYLLAARGPGVGEAYRRAIELNPNNVDALSAYAQWSWGHGNVGAAETYFRRALEIDRLSLVRYSDLAEYLGGTNQRQEALELAEEIRTRFDGARGDLALARLYELIGELDVAIAWARKAFDLAPNDPVLDAAAQVAELYARIGDFDGASRFEDPLDVRLGQLYLRRDYFGLTALAGEIVIEHPELVEVWYLLAFARNALGDYDDALHALAQTGLREYEETATARDGEALMTWIDALQASGHEPEALDLAGRYAADKQRSVATGSGSAWWPNTYLACALAVLGRDSEALDALERIEESAGLVWSPLLEDAHCFQRFKSNPRYEKVVESVEQRKAALRARLPETLRAHGLDIAE